MLGIQTDAWDTAGGVLMTVVGLGCAWWGGLAVLRPGRPPQPIGSVTAAGVSQRRAPRRAGGVVAGRHK